MKTYVINFQKGGVGKTTICANIAAALSEKNKKVLLIDTDPQDHLREFFRLTNGFQYESDGLDSVLEGAQILEKAVRVTENLALLTSGAGLLEAKAGFIKSKTALLKFQQLLGNPDLRGEFDFCLIDTTPTWDEMTYSVLYGADALIMPVAVSKLSYTSLAPFLEFAKAAHEQMMGAGATREIWAIPNFLDFRRGREASLAFLEEIMKLSVSGGAKGVLPPIHVNVWLEKLSESGDTIFSLKPRSKYETTRIDESKKNFELLADVFAGSITIEEAWARATGD